MKPLLKQNPNLLTVNLSNSEPSRDIGQYISSLKQLKSLNLSGWTKLKAKDFRSIKCILISRNS